MKPYQNQHIDIKNSTFLGNKKDHLGNVRVTFTDDGTNKAKLLSENHYYPFGLTIGGLGYVSGDNLASNNYKFTGKEDQNDHGYGMVDFGARHYDKKLGRWMCPDPLAEKYYEWSPYVYALNNPIRFIDPDGKQVIEPEKILKAAKKVAKEIKGSDKQCSQGARKILNELFGSKELYSKGDPEKTNKFHDEEGKMDEYKTQAKDQEKHMDESENFVEISSLKKASKLKENNLVFAVGDDHINVLLPGTGGEGSWHGSDGTSPKVFDTGGGKRWPVKDSKGKSNSKMTISYAWTKSSQSKVRFFVYASKPTQLPEITVTATDPRVQ